MRVVVDRLSKTFTDGTGHAIEALRAVSLTIEAEEFVALLGPSGCGKDIVDESFLREALRGGR